MDWNSINKKKTALWIIAVVGACSLIFLGVQNISSVFKAIAWAFDLVMPLILGFGLSLIFDVPLNFFEGHLFKKTNNHTLIRLRRPLAFVISVFIILGIVVGMLFLVIPELGEALEIIGVIVMDTVEYLISLDEAKIARLPFGEYLLKLDIQGILTAAQSWLMNQGGNIVNTAFGVVSTVVGGVIDIGVAIVFACYILLNKVTLKRQVTRLIRVWLPEKAGSMLLHTANVANTNFRNFISGQTLEAIILGGLCMLGMLILRIPYAPMIGALVCVTAFIPVIGGFIGAGVGAIMILTKEPLQALVFIIFIIILQQLENNFIYPRVMGKRVKLPSMWIFAAVAVGGSLAGPIGMLLSVPAASTAYYLLKEATAKRDAKKKGVEYVADPEDEEMFSDGVPVSEEFSSEAENQAKENV